MQKQETRTISLKKEDSVSKIERLLNLIGVLSWTVGFVIIGIAVVTAYTTPAIIQESGGSNGYVTIQNVEWRQVLLGLFLMGGRTITQGILWLKRRTVN